MTKRELIYSIIEKLNALSDDSNITEELVSHLIDSKRAMIIKQQYSQKYWDLPVEITQELCVGLELVEKIDGFSCAGKILVSTSSIPNSINFKGKDGPISIRFADDFAIPINVVSLERLPFVTASKYTSQQIFGCINRENKLILTSGSDKLKFLRAVRISDVFESPDTAYEMECNDNSSTLEPWDQNYPLESAMSVPVEDMVFKELARGLGIPEDKVNDADDDRRQ